MIESSLCRISTHLTCLILNRIGSPYHIDHFSINLTNNSNIINLMKNFDYYQCLTNQSDECLDLNYLYLIAVKLYVYFLM